MQIIKILICSFFLFVISGCANEKEKCVVIVDENNNEVYDVKLMFSVIKKRNFEKSGTLVTSFSPFYNTDISLNQTKPNSFCFKNYKYKDKQFIYEDLRSWKFYNNDYEIIFNSFSLIPSKITLKKKI